MSGIVDQIKDKVDIVDLISGYIKLQKSGINYKARCPFHNEKSGSFFVSPERQIWHCFGCGLGGDVFGFVKQIEGMEFPEALRILADKSGIKLERQSPEYQEHQNEKTRLYEISELACKFFEKQLHQSSVGKSVLEYLHGRGLADESIKSFRLGYAPDSWGSLCDFLKRSYESGEIINAGLIIKSDKSAANSNALNHFYDRFRSRIMFPIFDINGQVAGFTGRAFGDLASQDGVAKYVNTPQTQIYDKSRILYGLDKAKLEIRRNNKCLVVEGNMDVIMSHQAGARHVVASSGTAMTEGHLKIVKRYTDNLDLCFDADNAGTMATERGVDLALAKGFNVGIITISENDLKDPADYVKKYGQKWSEYVTKSKPFMDFYFETARKSFDLVSGLGKKLFSQKLLPFVAAVSNKIEQSHWVAEMALALKIKEDLLYRELASIKPRGLESGEEVYSTSSATLSSESDLNGQEETLLSIIIKKPDLAKLLDEERIGLLSAGFLDSLNKVKTENERGIASGAVADVQSGISLDFAFLKSQEMWKDFPDHELEEEFGKLMSQIKKRKLSIRLADLEYDIRTAEKDKSADRLKGLLEEFSKISKQLVS